MSGLKGDFIGFTFDKKHSSELGIVRVSEGSRYDENLLPSIEDKFVRVPGGDGNYFFGSYYTERDFNISIAFDNLSEEQFRKLRQHLNGKKKGELIFDEAPYKVYKVKVATSPNLKYICFDKEGDDGKRIRIYKGEGSISFKTLSPFAKSKHKWLSEYRSSTTSTVSTEEDNLLTKEDLYNPKLVELGDNVDEWAAASGMLEEQGDYDSYNNGTINLYNPGDVETDFILKLNKTKEVKNENTNNDSSTIEVLEDDSSTTEDSERISIQLDENPALLIDLFTLKDGDVSYQINSKTELIEGLDAEGRLTGNIYNEYIAGGSFFKIPLGDSTLTLPSDLTKENVEIKYDYLYF